MEGAFVGGVVAQKQSQAFLVDAGGREALALQTEGALHEPVCLGYFVDEEFFGRVGRLVVIEQVLEQRFEGGGVFTQARTTCNKRTVRFAWGDELTGGESVFEGITRRSQFAFGRDRAGGMGGVGAVASGDALAHCLSFLDEFGREFVVNGSGVRSDSQTSLLTF